MRKIGFEPMPSIASGLHSSAELFAHIFTCSLAGAPRVERGFMNLEFIVFADYYHTPKVYAGGLEAPTWRV